ncbi:MAG: transposase [Flavobacteriales bacterium]|nr:transposase [Flavobacteriales bacterium]
MIGRLLSAAFEGEMDAHLDQEKKRSNRRNGYTDKTVRTALGPVSVRPPRDRNGSFEPTIIKKWDRSLAPNWRTRSCICTARAPATRTLGTI